MWGKTDGEPKENHVRELARMFGELKDDVRKIKGDLWGTAGLEGLIPKMSAVLQKCIDENYRYRSLLETKRPERWHEVYMRVLSARIDANDSMDAHASALKVADAAYPPPPPEEKTP